MDLGRVARVSEFCLGVLFWLAPLVLYQDEESRIRNKLVDWWVSVTDTSEHLSSKQAALSKAIAAFTLRRLDRTFGSEFGGRTVLIGVIMVMGSALSFLPGAERPAEFSPITIIVLLFCLWGGPTWIYTALVLIVLGWRSTVTDTNGVVSTIFIIFAIETVFLLISQTITRRILLYVCDTSRFAMVALVGLLSVPVLLSGLIYAIVDGYGIVRYRYPHDMDVESVFVAGCSMDLIGSLLSAGVAVAAVAMIVNGLCWELLSRLLNSLYDKRALARTHFYAVGAFLISISAAPSTKEYLRHWLNVDQQGSAQSSSAAPK